MGQYYNTVFLGQEPETRNDYEFIRGWLYGYNYGEGIKLMEHSYLDTEFMAVVEYLLRPGGMMYKTRIAWAGDYADPDRAVFDVDDEEASSMTLYNACKKNNYLERQILKKEMDVVEYMKTYSYIVNHTKKMYVDKRNYEVIHPLPLLTAEGNGRGGGDYRGADEEHVGTWARDVISVEKKLEGLEGYTELEFRPAE
jgi:hypothetical protein